MERLQGGASPQPNQHANLSPQLRANGVQSNPTLDVQTDTTSLSRISLSSEARSDGAMSIVTHGVSSEPSAATELQPHLREDGKSPGNLGHGLH